MALQDVLSIVAWHVVGSRDAHTEDMKEEATKKTRIHETVIYQRVRRKTNSEYLSKIERCKGALKMMQAGTLLKVIVKVI